MWIFQKREQEVTRTSIIVLLSYIFQYVPSLLVHTFNPMPKYGNLPGLHIFCYMIFWTSTFFNTCLYIFSNRLYASAFEETFGFSIRTKQLGNYDLPLKSNPIKLKNLRKWLLPIQDFWMAIFNPIWSFISKIIK